MLSVIVPFYNEEENIAPLLRRYKECGANRAFELICIDNASTDGGPAALRALLETGAYPFVVSVHEEKKGYGHAIMAGLRVARGEVCAWTHADLQTDAADVFRALDAYRPGEKILVKGVRRGRRTGDTLFSLGMGIFGSLVLRLPLYEINAQPKLFPRALLDLLTDPPGDFSLDLYLLVRALRNGYRIRVIPVRFPTRLHGLSKSAPTLKKRLETIARTVRYVLRMR